MTLCDGGCVGVYMLGSLERNLEGDAKLNREKINSESLL